MDSTVVSSSKGGDGSGRCVPRRLMVGTGQTVHHPHAPRRGDVDHRPRARSVNPRRRNASVSRLHARLHVGPVLRVGGSRQRERARAFGGEPPAARTRPTPVPPGQVGGGRQQLEMMGRQRAAVGFDRHGKATARAPDAPRVRLPLKRTGGKVGLVIVDDAMRKPAPPSIERAAISDISILLLGETGVGKEVLARAHPPALAAREQAVPGAQLRGARRRPCSRASCSATSRAPSPARSQAKPGLLETADGGTVFLDEVGDIPAPSRSSCCASSRSGRCCAWAGPGRAQSTCACSPRRTATSRPTSTRAPFRRDLFFRLNGITIDIPAAARPAVGDRSARAALRGPGGGDASKSRRRPTSTRDVWDRLRSYQWPGNIRQLRNVMERAVVLAEAAGINDRPVPRRQVRGPGAEGAPVAVHRGVVGGDGRATAGGDERSAARSCRRSSAAPATRRAQAGATGDLPSHAGEPARGLQPAAAAQARHRLATAPWVTTRHHTEPFRAFPLLADAGSGVEVRGTRTHVLGAELRRVRCCTRAEPEQERNDEEQRTQDLDRLRRAGAHAGAPVALAAPPPAMEGQDRDGDRRRARCRRAPKRRMRRSS